MRNIPTSFIDCCGTRIDGKRCERIMIPSSEVLCLNGGSAICSFECLDRHVNAHPAVVSELLVVPVSFRASLDMWLATPGTIWLGRIELKTQ